MTRSQNNAFVNRDAGDERNPRTSLAGMLAPMRAVLEKTGFGYALTLSPMRPIDAAALWRSFTSDPVTMTLLSDVEVPAASGTSGQHGASRRPAAWEHRGFTVEGAFDGDAIAVETEALEALVVAVLKPSRMHAVLVEGPIEAGDVEAMQRAVADGQSPLDAELRAVAALQVPSDHVLVLHVRERTHALRLVGAEFRQYLAAIRNRPVREIDAPTPWQIERLFEVTGALSVRPIETEVFSTAIDVGISTKAEGAVGPADRSLIYDIFSNSWHDEP